MSRSVLSNNEIIKAKGEEDEKSAKRARYLVNRGDCYRALGRLSDAGLVSEFVCMVRLHEFGEER